MITRDDLFTSKIWIDPVDNAEWRNVEYGNDKFILVAVDMKHDDYVHVADAFLKSDPLLSLLSPYLSDEEINDLLVSQVDYLKEILPPVDIMVFRADDDWEIAGECSDECGKGVCTKRLAESSSGDIETAYSLLVDFLNA